MGDAGDGRGSAPSACRLMAGAGLRARAAYQASSGVPNPFAASSAAVRPASPRRLLSPKLTVRSSAAVG